MADRHWTPEIVAERLEEAADTLRRLPPVRVRGHASSWPEVVRDVREAYGWDEARPRLGPPSPAAIDAMDEALRWLAWLEPDEARLVWLRAEGVRWKLICYRFGVGRSTAWRRWVCALVKIAARLTGTETAALGRPTGCLRDRNALNEHDKTVETK